MSKNEPSCPPRLTSFDKALDHKITNQYMNNGHSIHQSSIYTQNMPPQNQNKGSSVYSVNQSSNMRPNQNGSVYSNPSIRPNQIVGQNTNKNGSLYSNPGMRPSQNVGQNSNKNGSVYSNASINQNQNNYYPQRQNPGYQPIPNGVRLNSGDISVQPMNSYGQPINKFGQPIGNNNNIPFLNNPGQNVRPVQPINVNNSNSDFDISFNNDEKIVYSPSYKATSASWVKYIINKENKNEDFSINDILKICLNKPNKYSRMILQDIVQKDSELKKSLTPILQYIDFTILGIDRSIKVESVPLLNNDEMKNEVKILYNNLIKVKKTK